MKQVILKQFSKKPYITVSQLVSVTGFSRKYVHRFFKQLQEEGKIVLIGRANTAQYVLKKNSQLATRKSQHWDKRLLLKNSKLSEDVVLSRLKKETGLWSALPLPVQRLIDYAFTEMLNNAIEHSRSKTIGITLSRRQKQIRCTIRDWGIGIFKHIQKEWHLHSQLAAIEHLMKGKQTTMPEAHSGEGIFFTSKAVDQLVIKSSGKKLLFDNQTQDIVLDNSLLSRGTEIRFVISERSKMDLNTLFKKYSDEQFAFNTTEVTVLLDTEEGSYLSRSQARRVLMGLDRFQHITLNFKYVPSVGQAFADEIFRVWKQHNLDKSITYHHANENVSFMIQRALKSETTR